MVKESYQIFLVMLRTVKASMRIWVFEFEDGVEAKVPLDGHIEQGVEVPVLLIQWDTSDV